MEKLTGTGSDVEATDPERQQSHAEFYEEVAQLTRVAGGGAIDPPLSVTPWPSAEMSQTERELTHKLIHEAGETLGDMGISVTEPLP